LAKVLNIDKGIIHYITRGQVLSVVYESFEEVHQADLNPETPQKLIWLLQGLRMRFFRKTRTFFEAGT
jgi:hypothetical protein